VVASAPPLDAAADRSTSSGAGGNALARLIARARAALA
jgi:hypothetical protein